MAKVCEVELDLPGTRVDDCRAKDRYCAISIRYTFVNRLQGEGWFTTHELLETWPSATSSLVYVDGSAR